MSYTATIETVDHIVELVHQESGWERGLVRVVLLSHAQVVDGSDLAIAALRWAASERGRAVGPKGIGWRGPHWDGLGTKPPEVAARDQRWCQVCMKPEPRCLTERPHPSDDHEFEPGRRVRLIR